ncbi:unnamed protein product [Effrenium voratum]|nr:unnamed protein product [Effrenium voratum]
MCALESAQRPRWNPELVAANKEIAASGRRSQWAQSLSLLAQLEADNLQKDVVSCNSALCGFSSARWRQALALFGQAAHFADGITYSACVATQPWRAALRLFSWPGGLSAANAAAAACGSLRSSRGGHLEGNWAWTLLLLRSSAVKRLQLDMVSFNVLAKAAEKAGTARWRVSLWLVSTSRAVGLEPDSITRSCSFLPWRAALQMDPGNAWQSSLGLREGPAARAVLGAYALAANWREALAALEPQANDDLSFLAALKACARALQQRHATELLRRMDAQRLRQSREIYTAAMSAANDAWGEDSSHGGWQWALGLLREMETNRLEVDGVAVSVALTSCLRARYWEEAMRLAQGFRAKGSDTPGISSALITANGLAHSWAMALASLEGHLGNVVVTALETQWQAALQVYEKMLAAACGDIISANSALSACAAGSQWPEACLLLQMTSARRLQVDMLTQDSAISAAGTSAWWCSVLILERSRHAGVECGVAGYSSALDACVHGNGWALGLCLGATMAQQAVQCHAMSQSLLMAECEQRALHEPLLAQQIQRLLPTDARKDAPGFAGGGGGGS